MTLPDLTLPYSLERIFDDTSLRALGDLSVSDGGDLAAPWALSIGLTPVQNDVPGQAEPDTHLVTTTQLGAIASTNASQDSFFKCRELSPDWHRRVASVFLTLFDDEILDSFLAHFPRHPRAFPIEKILKADETAENELVVMPGAAAIITRASPTWHEGLDAISRDLLGDHRFFVAKGGSAHQTMQGVSNLKNLLDKRLGRIPEDDEEMGSPPLANIRFERA